MINDNLDMFKIGMKLFEFTIAGKPVPAIKMTPSKTSMWGMYKQHKAKSSIDVSSAFKRELIDYPTHLHIEFLFPFTTTEESDDIQNTGEPHVKEPQISLLIRFVEETLLDSIYEDIWTPSSVTSAKFYSQVPKTIISIYELED